MELAKNDICPVCGAKRNALSLSEYDCSECGFTGAFLNYFAGKKSYDAWKTAVEAAKKSRETINIRSFVFDSSSVFFVNPASSVMTVVSTEKPKGPTGNIVQVSSSGQNTAVLKTDGTVTVYGENNSYYQKETGAWKDIRFVLEAPNCTYGVDGSGKLLYAGMPAEQKVSGWSDIRALACSIDHLLALKTNGTVECANVSTEIEQKIRGWNNIASIAAGKDCSVALDAKGTVHFAGSRENDPRSQCTAWNDIIQIAADDSYVYGLKKDGTVIQAGRFVKFLDKNRADAAQLHDIAFITCGFSSFAAIDKNGKLTLLGNTSVPAKELELLWQNTVNRDMLFHAT